VPLLILAQSFPSQGRWKAWNCCSPPGGLDHNNVLGGGWPISKMAISSQSIIIHVALYHRRT
jgi:hypothetical protein